ncbi:unnamed protein product [Caenorhabditis angaria]|uniref:C3H1-type domain-containing protein n=1 Tax=Caenorhabditis angaria TaxID=860376 RepID=A0A9P1N183_9PELO|nr:unnamed protein product [Caenorhabditis angaria]
MSEHGDHPLPEGKQDREDVCRDFLKNICNRGSRCKFFHPPDHKPSAAAPTNDNEYNFCIDYQNRGCRRDNCRFVHAPRDEVERYKQTRELTLVLARSIAAAGGHGDSIGGIPICKEFQTGRCARGAQRCRYWHVNVELERQRRSRGLPPTNEFAGGPPDDFINGNGFMGGNGGPPPPPMMGGGGGGRRRGYDDGGYDEMDMKRPRMMPNDHMIDLEKKNAELQKEVDSLRRELKREHERYEDLYALFRQQSGGAPAPPKAAGSAPTAPPSDYYSTSQPVWGALGGGTSW